jgi:hypothetical protein
MPSSTYVFNYCTDFSFDVVDGPQCSMEVDGVSCNSCEINVGGGDMYGENCEVFDCTNTGIKYAGDRCGAFANPTLLIESEINYLYRGERSTVLSRRVDCRCREHAVILKSTIVVFV